MAAQIVDYVPPAKHEADLALKVAKGELLINALDHGIQSGPSPIDNTAALQALINTVSANGGGVIVFPPGSYRINSVTVKAGVHVVGLGSPGAAYSVSTGNGISNTVNFVHVQGNTGAMLRIAGGGISMTNIALRGNDYAATGFPLMHVLNGFEFNMTHVYFFSKKGTVLLVDHMNNNTWFDVKITDGASVNGSAAVVFRGPTEAGFTDGENNTIDLVGLTIERYVGGPLFDIAYGTTGNYWLEFGRILNLHTESDSSIWNPTTIGPTDAHIRIGNVMGLVLDNPFVYGGKVPTILVDGPNSQRRAGAPMDPGIRIVTGSILGTKEISTNGVNPILVDLRNGDDVAFIGTSFGRCSTAAVRVQSTFGPNVSFDAGTRLSALAAVGVPMVLDQRTGSNFRTWTHIGSLRSRFDVIADRHFMGAANPVTSVTLGGNLGGTGGSVGITGAFDTHGRLVITTGAAPVSGVVAEVFFRNAYPKQPVIAVSSENGVTAGRLPFITPRSDGTGFQVGFWNTPVANTQYVVGYITTGNF